MSDEINVDLASERERLELAQSIAAIQAKPPAAVATGKCLECGAKLKKPLRWCDNFCRDDWQRWNPEA